MAEQLWCCARAGQRVGPVPFARLRQMAAAGEVARTDLVWPDGRPEEAAPAAAVPGLFPAAPVGPPRGPSLAAWAAAAWDALSGCLQVLVSLVIGVVMLGVLSNVFCDRAPPPVTGPPPKPLPVEVGFRASAVGRGMVLRVRNVSDRPLNGLTVSVTAVGGAPVGRVPWELAQPLEPGREVVVGWAELGGWPLAPGETVRLSVTEPGFEAIVLTVPAKAPVW